MNAPTFQWLVLTALLVMTLVYFLPGGTPPATSRVTANASAE